LFGAGYRFKRVAQRGGNNVMTLSVYKCVQCNEEFKFIKPDLKGLFHCPNCWGILNKIKEEACFRSEIGYWGAITFEGYESLDAFAQAAVSR